MEIIIWQNVETKAEIIQVTSEGVSVAFRNLNRDDDKLLNLFF